MRLGGARMKIAVACRGFEIAARYDLCESFTFYTITKGVITNCQNIPNTGISSEALAEFFVDNDVVALICDAIQIDNAKQYCNRNIEVVAGVNGNAQDAVKSYLTKELSGANEVCEWDDEY